MQWNDRNEEFDAGRPACQRDVSVVTNLLEQRFDFTGRGVGEWSSTKPAAVKASASR